MRLLKFAIFYTFIGIYETGLFLKMNSLKVKNSFTSAAQKTKTATTAPQRMKGALLKTAFRSIL